jgi:hypothetical protein
MRTSNQRPMSSARGFGIPAPIDPPPPAAIKRHLLAPGYEIEIKLVLGGLRHWYGCKKVA